MGIESLAWHEASGDPTRPGHWHITPGPAARLKARVLNLKQGLTVRREFVTRPRAIRVGGRGQWAARGPGRAFKFKLACQWAPPYARSVPDRDIA
eukprot:3461370-Rhodomonas_salina.2